MTARRTIPLFAGSRLALLLGFGGLLLLMAFAGLDGIRALGQIQSANDAIREDFLLRTRVLERIRSDVYVSGTYVRDYLLEPEAGKAESHRNSLIETRRDADAALAQYRSFLSRPESQPVEVLTRELAEYWTMLEPVFRWTPEQRRDGLFFCATKSFRGAMRCWPSPTRSGPSAKAR